MRYNNEKNIRDELIAFSDYDTWRFKSIFQMINPYNKISSIVEEAFSRSTWMEYVRSITTMNNIYIPVLSDQKFINTKVIDRDEYYVLSWLCYKEQKDAVEKDFQRFSNNALKILA